MHILQEIERIVMIILSIMVFIDAIGISIFLYILFRKDK